MIEQLTAPGNAELAGTITGPELTIVDLRLFNGDTNCTQHLGHEFNVWLDRRHDWRLQRDAVWETSFGQEFLGLFWIVLERIVEFRYVPLTECPRVETTEAVALAIVDSGVVGLAVDRVGNSLADLKERQQVTVYGAFFAAKNVQVWEVVRHRKDLVTALDSLINLSITDRCHDVGLTGEQRIQTSGVVRY